jgi:hypothetical protein
MSDRVVPIRPAVPLRSWTDGAMPTTRASRRRWVVAYALLVCLIYASVLGWRAIEVALVVAFAALGAVFLVLTVSTRELAGDRLALDERDEIARDQAFRRAYRLLLAAFGVAILASMLVPRDSREIAIVTWFVPWALFLPTGMLAWHEPDDLEPPPGEPALGMSELVRDALLGSGVAAGVAVAIVSGVGFAGLLPLIAALALAAGVARREAGQPVLRVRTAAKLVAAYVVLMAAVGLVLGLLFGNSP